MDANEFALWLEDAITQLANEEGLDVHTRQFRDAGLLTSNEGVVVRIGDYQFQVQVVQSR